MAAVSAQLQRSSSASSRPHSTRTAASTPRSPGYHVCAAFASELSATYSGQVRPEHVIITAGCNQAFFISDAGMRLGYQAPINQHWTPVVVTNALSVHEGNLARYLVIDYARLATLRKRLCIRAFSFRVCRCLRRADEDDPLLSSRMSIVSPSTIFKTVAVTGVGSALAAAGARRPRWQLGGTDRTVTCRCRGMESQCRPHRLGVRTRRRCRRCRDPSGPVVRVTLENVPPPVVMGLGAVGIRPVCSRRRGGTNGRCRGSTGRDD